MTFEELATVYEALAQAIDRADAQSEIFMAKVILTLAHGAPAPAPVLSIMEDCLLDLSR